MDLHEVVMKLVGPINPVGDSGIDRERLANITSLTLLVDQLLFDISMMAPDADRQEASMKAIGLHARKFLQSIKEAD